MRTDLVEWIRQTTITHSLSEIYHILVSRGHLKEKIKDELIEVFGSDQVEQFYIDLDLPKQITINNTTFPDVIINKKNYIEIDGRVCRVLFELKTPRVVMVDNFISNEECEELIRLAIPEIKRSTVVNRKDSSSEVNDVRTSSGMFFQKRANSLVTELENRIALFSNWDVSKQEGFQLLNYQKDQEYREHYDYFDENSPTVSSILARGGQRVGTVIMYLNNCPEGGGTLFPESGLEIKPSKGYAVFFGYPNHDKESKTLHAGSPVVNGEKWIAVKWLRQREFI